MWGAVWEEAGHDLEGRTISRDRATGFINKRSCFSNRHVKGVFHTLFPKRSLTAICQNINGPR